MVNLFGRNEAQRLLADATAAARAGRGGLVVLRADPGLGVTTLLDAHLSAARELGMRAHRIPVLPQSGTTTLSAGAPNWTEPATIAIDDLHRADDATLLALHELAEGLRDRPLLVVAGRHRGVEPARFAALDRLATAHDLEPLDDCAVRAVLTEFSGGEPPESLLRLADGAGGNPWLLARLTADDRATAVTAWATGLAGDDAALLRFAAILAEPASVDELAAVAGTTPVDALARIVRLAGIGLLAEEGGLVRFRHPVVRQDLAATSAGLRGSAARALAARNAVPRAVAEQLAHTPVDAWTVDWLDEHADRLAARPTPAVVDLFHRAVSGLPPGDRRLHPLRAALAEALMWSGRTDESQRIATASLAAHPDTTIRHRLRAVLALICFREMDPAAAIAALDPERVDGKLSGRLAAIDAAACLAAGDLTGTERAVELATPAAAHDPLVEVFLLNVEATGLFVFRDLDGALERLDRADALLQIAVDDRGLWLMSRLLRAVVQDLRHDKAALETVEQARPIAREIGAGLLTWLHTIAALASFNNGLWDRALDEIGAAMALPDQYGLAGPLHGVASMIMLHRGDLPAARVHAELAERSPGRGVAVFYEQIAVLASAHVADAEGNSQRALEIVHTLAAGDVGVHHAHAVATVGARLVRIAVTGGDRDLANRLVAQMRDLSTGESAGERGALMYCQGLVDSDVDVLLAAAQEFTDTGSPILAARAAEDAAKVLAASGRSADARAAYQTAIDQYTALTATGDINRADAALRAFGLRRGATGSRRRPKHGWESLTAAEYRVAELVAQGLTNRETAERLILSVRTVDSHVSRVLSKLGYSSRIEIALGFGERE
ncbi:helix-turn-helix transcriptional regulator [Saccharopolyspora shandongensis]|uniref:helix-turn-helix transcriptional regulator n=1 Tax=Saccharopolyspora shandongensis TaxID=418495 RepID=UPI0033F844A8